MKRKSKAVPDDHKRDHPPGHCPICKELFSNPYITTCGHTFCEICLSKSFEYSTHCPVCDAGLEKRDMFPNKALQQLLKEQMKSKEISFLINSPPFLHSEMIEKIQEWLENSSKPIVETVLNALQEKKQQEEELKRSLTVYFLEKLYETKERERVQLESHLEQIQRDLNKISEIPSLNHSLGANPVLMENQSLIENHSLGTSAFLVENQSLGTNPCLIKNQSLGTNSLPQTIQANYPLKTNSLLKNSLKKSKNKDSHMKRIDLHLNDFSKIYLESKKQNGADFYSLSEDLLISSKYSKLKTLAVFHYADNFFNYSSSIVSSVEFDKDDAFFATAGVTKKIRIFNFQDTIKQYNESQLNLEEERLRDGVVQESDSETGLDQTLRRYPLLEMSCFSKISCLSWSVFHKSHLVSSDYEGCVSLWDASLGLQQRVFQEHEKRVWSVDFSDVEADVLASGGDDSKVKVWDMKMQNSTFTIESKANVCSVKFHPSKSHELVFGSAGIFLYYLITRPSCTLL